MREREIDIRIAFDTSHGKHTNTNDSNNLLPTTRSVSSQDSCGSRWGQELTAALDSSQISGSVRKKTLTFWVNRVPDDVDEESSKKPSGGRCPKDDSDSDEDSVAVFEGLLELSRRNAAAAAAGGAGASAGVGACSGGSGCPISVWETWSEQEVPAEGSSICTCETKEIKETSEAQSLTWAKSRFMLVDCPSESTWEAKRPYLLRFQNDKYVKGLSLQCGLLFLQIHQSKTCWHSEKKAAAAIQSLAT